MKLNIKIVSSYNQSWFLLSPKTWPSKITKFSLTKYNKCKKRSCTTLGAKFKDTTNLSWRKLEDNFYGASETVDCWLWGDYTIGLLTFTILSFLTSLHSDISWRFQNCKLIFRRDKSAMLNYIISKIIFLITLTTVCFFLQVL